MLKITIGGKSIRSDQFTDEMMNQAFRSAVDELRERYSAIRHPKTGEFPTVIVLGTSLDDFSLRLEGSKELMDIVREKFSDEELEGVELYTTDTPKVTPKVFLSYAGEDQEDAKRIANALTAQGIDTWWAEWSLSAGDSLRQKIDEGLAGCTFHRASYPDIY